ncbi:Aldose 1-epimerase [Lachnospiraceae bacterium TWA4]|nr:Aldose 1-epimerase [Lachnospiraceae bacterium TWA4]
MSITVSDFGKGTHLYKITDGDYSIEVTDFGATLVSIFAPDKNGTVENVVLGYKDVTGYQTHSGHIGATVGRNANRIANANVTINGVTYPLTVNDNDRNNLHSGLNYYDQRIWETLPIVEEENRVIFYLKSPHMDQGFPGNAGIWVAYSLTSDHEVCIKYNVVCDKDTIVNMTNHSYFNLTGNPNKTIFDHKVWVNADYYTPLDEFQIPTGKLQSVEGTLMDFRNERPVANEYDHNWVLKNKRKCELVATCKDEASGRIMEVYTDLPGMQIYTGNGLKDPFIPHSAICFESQYFPDSIHHENFKSPILKANQMYESVTKYRFRAA